MSLLRRLERMAAQGSLPGLGDAPTGAAPPTEVAPASAYELRRGTVASAEWGPQLCAALVEAGGPDFAGVRELWCIDTETTGLGGSTHPFVTGLARVQVGGCVDAQVELEQYCLTHAAGELAAMRALFERLGDSPAGALLSFNGRSFDLPLLRRRALRLGLRLPPLLADDAPHLDALALSRRLYAGAFDDCRLQTLEAELLGQRRRGDIPSWQIPAVFEAFVAAPQSPDARARYERVVHHNRLDLLSLPALVLRLVRELRAPSSLPRALRCALHLARVSGDAAGLEHLRVHLAPRLEGLAEELTTPAFKDALALRRAALEGARWSRRLGCPELGEGWLRAARARFPDDPDLCEALAKALEHRLRDPAQALLVARASAQPCSRRIARLQAKLGQATAGRADFAGGRGASSSERKGSSAAALDVDHGSSRPAPPSFAPAGPPRPEGRAPC